jgi:kynurenine 3-monooxygenase
MSGEPDGKKKVFIIGAGPAGLLAAHLLLKQAPGKFDVTVAEQRADPRESEQASLRSYSLGLGVRGRTSIKKAGDEVWDVVKRRGVECERFSLHLGKRVLQIRQESPVLITEPSVLINRADLCAALLDGFKTAPDTPTLKFETQCVQIDPEARTVCLQSTDGKQEKKTYDVLIGADGVNSKVRESMLKASAGQIRFAQAALNGTLKTIHQPMPAALDPLSVHAMGGSIKVEEGGEDVDAKKRAAERLGLFWVPERNRTTGEQSACALINWDPSTAPTSLLQAQSADEVQRILNEAFPTLEGGISLSSAHQFLSQRPALNYVNKLSAYHHSPSRIVLLGDAAHCTGGASGQGCNSALEDAAVLTELLTSSNLNVEASLLEFSRRRVEEGHALLDLAVTANQPRAAGLRVAYLVINGLEGLGHKLLPNIISPPTQNLLTQTDLAFTEIYRRKAWILDKIKASNTKLGVFSGY